MRKTFKLLAVVVCLAGLAAPNVWAAVTADSTTWEGFYEGDVLPSAEGWTVAGDEATYASVSGGILTVDTMLGTGLPDVGMYWYRSPAFNLTSGASVEWRVRLANMDTPNPAINWASSLTVSDGAATMYVSTGADVGVGAMAYTTYSSLHAGNGLGEWNTVRITAEAGQMMVSVNGVLSPVDAGAPGAWADLRLMFGDATGAQDAVTEIDYVRWTTAGAFVVPEPISLCLLAVGGLVIRRRR